MAAILSRRSSTQKLKGRAAEDTLTGKKRKELYAEEKEFRSKRKLVQEKRIKFAARIPAFMYLTDFRENTLQDVITKLESELFLNVTGLAAAAMSRLRLSPAAGELHGAARQP